MSHLDKITPLPRKPIAAERVAEQLKELIRSGNLKAGDLLPSENELAGALHVSRPVVREALRGLQLMGLLDTRQGGRCSVAAFDVSRLLEPFQFMMGLTEANVDKLYEARVTVECALIRLGAPVITDAALAELREIADSSFEMKLPEDPVAFRVMDLKFHETLMGLAGNPFLEGAAKSLYSLGMDFRRVASQTRGVIERSLVEHADIVKALATRDPERAGQAMREHLTSIHRTTFEAMQRLAAANAAECRA